MDANTNYSALIINSTQIQSISSAIPLTFVDSGQAAVAALQDQKKRFAAIFIDPVLSNPGGVKLISLAHRARPCTPIYVLYDRTPPFSEQELTRLAVQGAIQMPLSSNAIRSHIASEIFDYVFDLAAEPELTNPSPEDDLYFAVPATDLLGCAPSAFDIHVRLPSGKYFKVLSAHEAFKPDRILGYLEKGLTHFYLSRASHQRCLTYCDMLARFLLTRPTVSFNVKLSDVFNRGAEVAETIRLQPSGPIQLDYAMEFVAQVHAIIRQMDPRDRTQIQAFLSNMTLYDSAVSTTMLTALLALPLKIESDQALGSIGLASLLHDIGLYRMSPVVQQGDEEKMSTEERALYRTHPAVGAELLSRIPDIGTVTLQAVAQHHERRNKRGFPGKVSGNDINRIAELIGISDEFLSILRRAKEDPSIQPLKEMQERVFDGFSYPVIESFRTVFMASSGQNQLHEIP